MPGSPRSGYQLGQVLTRALFLACRQLSSCCALIWLHLILIISVKSPSHWELETQHMNFEDTQTFSPWQIYTESGSFTVEDSTRLSPKRTVPTYWSTKMLETTHCPTLLLSLDLSFFLSCSQFFEKNLLFHCFNLICILQLLLRF